MSDHDAVEPVPEASSSHPSRRSVLRAGLFALSAAQLPDIVGSRAFAQGTKPVPNLVGKLEGADGPEVPLAGGHRRPVDLVEAEAGPDAAHGPLRITAVHAHGRFCDVGRHGELR